MKRKKDMRVNSVMTKNLAKSADLLNTVGGGTVFPTFDSYKEEDHYKLVVSIPSVNSDDVRIEVNGDQLLIYQNMEIGDVVVPSLLGAHTISADVAINSITAGYDDELLIVIMPFNELSNGFRKEIDILRY